ncbi:MAG: hypothetical protein WA783_21680 [Phormidesmis sp.]
MTLLKSISTRAGMIQKSLLVLAAIGLAFPGVGAAQVDETTELSSDTRSVLADGNYLFGQSANPNVAGSTYAVISVEDNQAVGAFYQPNSSFDCFEGKVLPDRLAVDIVNSYEQTVYPYEVALEVNQDLVAGNAADAYTLEGFHQLEGLGAQDLEILAVCKADFAR